MSKPLVSIVIPAFNASEYIVDTLESAFRQTYPHLEVIVIDDGSTDDTKARISNFIDDGKIRYQFQPNRGLAAARNSGIKLAQGKYLQFLDADDLLSPSKIEKQVQQLEMSATPAISGTDFRCFEDSDASSLSGGDVFKGEFPLKDVDQLFEFQTVIHRWLFPASLVQAAGGFEEDMPATEDWLLLWKLAADGTRFIYVDEPLALYRKHDSNMTRDFKRIAVGHLLAIDEVERYQKRLGLTLYRKGELNALRESFHYEFGLHYVRQNKIIRGWYHFGRAFFLSSDRRQPKLLLLAGMPVKKSETVDWAKSADARLWRWRAQLRRVLNG